MASRQDTQDDSHPIRIWYSLLRRIYDGDLGMAERDGKKEGVEDFGQFCLALRGDREGDRECKSRLQLSSSRRIK